MLSAFKPKLSAALRSTLAARSFHSGTPRRLIPEEGKKNPPETDTKTTEYTQSGTDDEVAHKNTSYQEGKSNPKQEEQSLKEEVRCSSTPIAHMTTRCTLWQTCLTRLADW